MHLRYMAVHAILSEFNTLCYRALEALCRRSLHSELPKKKGSGFHQRILGLDEEGPGNCRPNTRLGTARASKNRKEAGSSSNTNMYFVKDKDGWTPLHIAVMEGRVDAVKILLDLYSYSVKKLRSQADGCRGSSTGFHLSTPREQLQKEGSAPCSSTKNSDGFAAGNIETDHIDGIISKNRDTNVLHRDIPNDSYVIIEENTQVRENIRGLLLVAVTLLATVTFYTAACRVLFPISKLNSSRQVEQDISSDSTVTHFFIIFNSIGFTASVAIIIFLLRDFPLKPWPQIAAFSLFFSYICLIRAISPYQALPLLLLSIPCLAFAALGKLYGFSSNYAHGRTERSHTFGFHQRDQNDENV